MCVDIPFILDVRLVDVSAGSHRRKIKQYFSTFSSAVLALIFLVRRIQPFLSLADPRRP